MTDPETNGKCDDGNVKGNMDARDKALEAVSGSTTCGEMQLEDIDTSSFKGAAGGVSKSGFIHFADPFH